MRGFLHHWLASTRYIAGRPLAWALLPLAVLVGPSVNTLVYATAWAVHRGGIPSTPTVTLTMVLFFAVWACLPLLLYGIVAGLLPIAQGAPSGSRYGALPALPLSPRVRVVAEALAALGLILLARVGVACLLWSLWPPFHAVRGAPWHFLRMLATDLLLPVFGWDLLLGFPWLVARGAGSRLGRYDGGRVIGVAAISLVLVFSAFLTTEIAATLLPGTFGLSLLLIATAGREPSCQPLERAGQQGARILWRPALSPARRFCADGARRSAVVLGGLLVPGLACVVAVPVLPLPPGPMRLLLLVLLSLGALLLVAAAVHPLGITLLPPSSQADLFASRYCASWSWLPVRPERVRRVVYAHGLAVGGGLATAAGLILAHVGLLAPGSWFWGVAGLGLLAGVMPVLSLAGAILAAAVEDRVRSMAAGTGTLLAWLALLLFLVSKGGGPLLDVVCFLIAAAGVSALLPLVHLRRQRHVA